MSSKKLKPDFVPGKITDKGGQGVFKNIRGNFINLDRPNILQSKATYGLTGLIAEESFKPVQEKVLKFVQQVLKSNGRLIDAASREAAYKTASKLGGNGAIFKIGNDMIKEATGEPYDGMAGNMYFKASANAKADESGLYEPQYPIKVVDIYNEEIPKHEWAAKLYSGCWFDIAVSFSPYPKTPVAPAGVKVYLSAVMKLKDDTRFGSSSPFESREDMAGFSDDDMGIFDPGNGEEEEKPAKSEKNKAKSKAKKK